MSYVVLARKYRPRSFAQMVGQEHVVQALSNALTQGRLHHAYLFTGTRGIGKTTVSRILAKSLNCTGPDGQGGVTAEPCGLCPACTEIDADRYMDYIELDAASNRSIDEIRDLIERAAYKPSTGRFKVFMIDEAHQLTKDAFNALLKTLEEPPEYLKFVLATTDPEKMLPTVLSRCLQFNLRPMAPTTVRDHLQHVLQAEGVPHDEASLRLLGRAARGSMRDGLSLTDQAIAYGGGKLSETTLRDMLGSVDRGHVRALLEALAARNGAAVLAGVDGLRSLGLSAAGTLEEMALVLQQMAIEQAVPGALDQQDPDTEDARALSSRLAPAETQLLYSMALHGREELTLMSDEYGALTMVLLRFLAFPPVSAGQPATAEVPRSRAPAAAPLRASPPPRITLPAAPAAKATAAVSAAPAQGIAPTRGATATAVARPSPVVTPSGLAAAPSVPAAAPTPELAAPAAQTVDPAATALADRWYAAAKLLQNRALVSGMAETLAMHSGLQRVDDGTTPARWTLRVEREMLRTPALRDKLQAALSQALEHPVDIELEAGIPDDSPHKRDTAERARRQAAAVAAIEADPLVRDLLSQYATARIVPGSIKPVESKET